MGKDPLGLSLEDSSQNIGVATESNSNGKDALVAKLAETKLLKRIEALEEDLAGAKASLQLLRGDEFSESRNKGEGGSKGESLIAPPAEKRGYLFRWVDRNIGWSGSKWSLRFVTLENGKIAYYGSHTEASPRYVLSLRGCAVRDDGFKANKRFKVRGKNPPALDIPGAYFFLFSIYLREAELPSHEDPTETEEVEVVALLRFSTNSLAEQRQWMQLIAETCAYCETDEFLNEMERRENEQTAMAMALPEAKAGTLPPLYFGTARPKPHRKPSFTRIPSSKLFRSHAKSQNAEKVDAQSRRGYPPSKPMHRISAPSYLSIEAPTQNYRGFLNFGVIILLVSNARLILGSVNRHGFVLWKLLDEVGDFSEVGSRPWENFPVLFGFFLIFALLVVSFAVEYMLSRNKINEVIGVAVHYLNAHSVMVSSTWIVWTQIDRPLVGAILLMQATVTWMKLISYIHANQDYRLSTPEEQKKSMAVIENLDVQEEGIMYPKNVTLGNLIYFWVAPTLTYQLAFPKYPRVRLWKIAGILMRMIPILAGFMFITAQFVTPNLSLLVTDLEKNNGKYTVQMLAGYWLRLAIANSYLWLMMFYFYFHLWLNLCAELCRWGDRVFYKDWWNSSEVSAYWRLWNMPVHYWLVRHFYFPLIRMNCSKKVATVAVFFFSAVIHELLVSVPFHIIRPWSFLGMMGQIPLVALTKWLSRKYPDGFIGNVIFWVSFCVVGQPMAILMYTVDYRFANRDVVDCPAYGS